MPSSTSNSDPGPAPKGILQREGALPAGLRQTASDRPGEAQPVPTRDIPKQPWGGILLGVAAALVVSAIALEVKLRAPSNAVGFNFDFDAYSHSWPERICSVYDDVFTTLMDPEPKGTFLGIISFDASLKSLPLVRDERRSATTRHEDR